MSFGDGIGELKNVLSTLTPVGEAQAASRSANTTLPASSGTAPADEASLSSASGLVSKALAIPDVRMEKVEALRQAIADGSYQVPSSEVAGKVIESLIK